MFSSFRLLSIYYRNNMHCYCSSKCIANNHHIVHDGYIIHANLFSMRLAIRWQIKYEACRSPSGANGIQREREQKMTFSIVSIWNLLQLSTPNYVNARFFKMHFSRFIILAETHAFFFMESCVCEHAFNATKMRFMSICFYLEKLFQTEMYVCVDISNGMYWKQMGNNNNKKKAQF